jgi:hypothetical protein
MAPTLSYGGTETFTATVTNSSGDVPDDPILFAVSTPASGTSCGTFSPALTETSSSGTVSSTYTASTDTSSTTPATPCTVTAIEGYTDAHGSTTVTQATGPSSTVIITSSPTGDTVGIGTSITVDASATNLPSGTDTFAYSVSGTGCGTFSPTSAAVTTTTSDTTGSTSSTYTAGATV